MANGLGVSSGSRPPKGRRSRRPDRRWPGWRRNRGRGSASQASPGKQCDGFDGSRTLPRRESPPARWRCRALAPPARGPASSCRPRPRRRHVPHAFGLATWRHQLILELLDVERAERHPMGAAAQHVGHHQQASHSLCLLALQPGRLEKVGDEVSERLNGVTSFGHPDGLILGCVHRARLPLRSS